MVSEWSSTSSSKEFQTVDPGNQQQLTRCHVMCAGVSLFFDSMKLVVCVSLITTMQLTSIVTRSGMVESTLHSRVGLNFTPGRKSVPNSIYFSACLVK